MTKCIEWPKKSRDKDGYGIVKVRGKQTGAHRVALEIKIGRRLKKGEIAMHECDNPPCYNADHLRVGSILENNRRARAKSDSLANRLLKGWDKLYG